MNLDPSTPQPYHILQVVTSQFFELITATVHMILIINKSVIEMQFWTDWILWFYFLDI